MWIAKPLSFQTLKSKAKVISSKWYHQLLVFPWLLRYPGHEIHSEIEVEFLGHLRDSDQTKKDLPMGTLRFKIEAYDLSKPFILDVKNGNLEAREQGPFSGAPVPANGKGEAIQGANLGIFTVTARVTESDVSNVSKSIEKAAKYISSKKEEWQKKASEAVAPPVEKK